MVEQKKKKKKLMEIAYEKIKEAISSNQIKHGAVLSEKMLCEMLEMSRTPIREALRMLEKEDLIEIRDGVGTFVKTISTKDIEDAYELRRALELLAIESAINEFTEEELNKMHDEFQHLYDRLLNDTLSIEEYAEADLNLHDMIVHKSKNRYLKKAMDEIRSPLQRYQMLSVKVVANAEKSMQEHLLLIEQIRKKDLLGVKKLLKEHVRY